MAAIVTIKLNFYQLFVFCEQANNTYVEIGSIPIANKSSKEISVSKPVVFFEMCGYSMR